MSTPPAWFCAMHRRTTTSDCPACEAEQIADLERCAQQDDEDAGRTLYAAILAGLIEWAGESADLEDCRSAARHLTPVVRAHFTSATASAKGDE